MRNLEPTDLDYEGQLLLEQCATENPLVYLPRELVKSLQQYEQNKSDNQTQNAQKLIKQTLDKQKLKAQRMKRRNHEDPKEDNIDIKTNIAYKSFKRKVEDFKWVLTDPNMNLIQSVINGDSSAFTRGDHDMITDDSKKKKAEIYQALFGLQSIMKGANDEKRQLKDCLNILAPRLRSNLPKLEQLLLFFITKEISS